MRSWEHILALALNFVRASSKHTGTQVDRWKKPLQNQVALNVDAAYSEEDHTGAGGAILRDKFGTFIGAMTAKFDHVADVLSAEAAALTP